MVYCSLKFYDLIFTMVYWNCEGFCFLSFSQRLRHPSELADLILGLMLIWRCTRTIGRGQGFQLIKDRQQTTFT